LFCGLAQQSGQRAAAQRPLDRGQSFVEAGMQRTQSQLVLDQSRGVLANARQRIDGLDHLQYADPIRTASQEEATAGAGLRPDDRGASQLLEHFGEISGGDVNLVGDVLNGPDLPRMAA
jgi:hypothetical protein